MSPPLTPSSADNGFILAMPPLENPFTSDGVFQRILGWYIPQSVLSTISPELQRFASDAVSDRIHSLIGNAEAQPPYIKTRNVWGARYDADRLVTTTGWKELGRWGIQNGVVALGYENTYGEYRRLVQHAFNYIFSASSAAYSCPVSMTSGASRLVWHQLSSVPTDHPFHELFARLTARENNWISAQWMTERPGGSDVRNAETVAVHSPLPSKTGRFGRIDEGDYLLTGFKFFSSATDCNIAFLLAKESDNGELSLFVAPTRKTVSDPDGTQKEVTNGVRIHRLKNKFGTKELPTAELELMETRAHRVGAKGRGVATIALLLNVTRTHNFVTALSCLRRCIDIVKNFAKVRRTIDQPLSTFPMHLRLLSQLEVKHRGLLHLAFFTTSLLSFSDNGFPSSVSSTLPLTRPGEESKIVLRALTATSKAVICKSATLAFQDCQEGMGGVGYMDEPDEPEFNVSRLWRDTASNSVWEGTTNVLASETVRHLTRGNNLRVFSGWFERSVSKITDADTKPALGSAWNMLREKMTNASTQDGLTYALAEGRQIMFTLAWAVSGLLLVLDAQRDRNEVSFEVARRWILDGEGVPGGFAFPSILHVGSTAKRPAGREKSNWDCRVVWGDDLPVDAATGYRVESKL